MLCEVPLTKEQQTFATAHHSLVYKFLNENRLPEDEFYDVVIFGYLKAVRDYFSDLTAQQFTFSTIANRRMKFCLNRMAAFTPNTCLMAKNWMLWIMRGTPSTSGGRKANLGADLSGCISPCEDWREKSTDSATPITAAGGVWMGVPPPCPSGSRHLTLLMAANSSSRRKVPHSKLPSSMQMVQRSSASIGVKRTWQPS